MTREIFEIDIANQIDNLWNRDTVMALVGDKLRYALRIRNHEKNILRKKFFKFIPKGKRKSPDAKHNKKVVCMIYSYLIYKILYLNRRAIENVLICRDYRPTRLVHSYIQRMSSHFGHLLLQNIRIKFRKKPVIEGIKTKIPKSKANRHAIKVFRGIIKEDYHIHEKDLKELIDFINKHL